MIDQWITEIKKNCPPESLGMILVHNGLVRATSKEGRPVSGMKLSYDRAALDELVRRMRDTDGIVDIRILINEGELELGGDLRDPGDVVVEADGGRLDRQVDLVGVVGLPCPAALDDRDSHDNSLCFAPARGIPMLKILVPGVPPTGWIHHYISCPRHSPNPRCSVRVVHSCG